MNWKERILNTFYNKKVDRVVWQPRIEHWYNYHKKRGTLPSKYKNASILDIYDDLGASVRYYGGPFIKRVYDKNVRFKKMRTAEMEVTIIETPLGVLRESKEYTEHGTSCHHTEYFLKNLEDIKIMEYILEGIEYEFDDEAYEKAENEIGDRGVIQFFYDRSPFQRLVIDYMGFENTIYALSDYPDRMERFMKVIEKADDRLYKVLVTSPVRILNFGENIDACLDAPPLFEKYLLPYYQRRVTQLHEAGKVCHIHLDGSLKPLLPFLKENRAGFDGYEACTPSPQGDITIEELKSALGDDIVLLDGIPALLFLPSYSYEELEEFTLKILRMFYPRLILGISDELPPFGDIEKVRFVSKILENFNYTLT